MMMAGSRAQAKLKRMIINFHHKEKRRMKDIRKVIWNNDNKILTITKKSQHFLSKTVCASNFARRSTKLISNKDFSLLQINNLHSNIFFHRKMSRKLRAAIVKLSQENENIKYNHARFLIKWKTFLLAKLFMLPFNIPFIVCIAFAYLSAIIFIAFSWNWNSFHCLLSSLSHENFLLLKNWRTLETLNQKWMNNYNTSRCCCCLLLMYLISPYTWKHNVMSCDETMIEPFLHIISQLCDTT